MTFRMMQFREGVNREYTATQRVKGLELQELIDRGADEAMVTKAGFTQDGLGQWFYKAGDIKATLDTDSALGKAGAVVTIPQYVVIPTPLQLQPAPLKRVVA